MSIPFHDTAEAAAGLYTRWREAARHQPQRSATPSLLELQTICREAGVSLPDLDSFARIRDLLPMVMVCSQDVALAADVAKRFGFDPKWEGIPDAALIWCLSGDAGPKLRVRHAGGEQELSRRALGALLTAPLPPSGFLVVEEHSKAEKNWSLAWVPQPRFLQAPDGDDLETEFLLRQRAAVVVDEEIPAGARDALKELNQKLWVVPRGDLESAESRGRLLDEIATLADDRAEHIALRVTATWRWLVERLLARIEELRSDYKQRLNQFEIKISSARHLLRQYRTNWLGGIRGLVESHFGQRAGSAAFSGFLDASKPAPQADTFVAALALTTLNGKLDEYLTDRMADLVGGLGGLATKLELRRIPLGDTNVRWDFRSLIPKLEAHLRKEGIFPSGGKRAGLGANLTGKKQQVSRERREQLSRAVREAAQFIVRDFADWTGELTTTLERTISLQLTAALANQGLPDAEGMRTAQAGLDRLEEALRSRKEATIRPEATVAEWLAALSRGGLIPLYQPS